LEYPWGVDSDTSARAFVEPIRTTRTFETAIEHLVDGIEQSRIQRGERLPSEIELSRQLNISRPTLRQALRILERAGVLATRRGSGGGIFLAADLIPLDVIGSFVEIEENSVIDVLIGRRVLETAITHVAAEAATNSDYVDLGRSIQLLTRSLGDRAMVLRADAMFHRTVARAGRNRTLQQAMNTLLRQLSPILDAYRPGAALDRTILDIHSRQVSAMRRNDGYELDRVLDEHFRILEEAYAVAHASTWAEMFGGRSPHWRSPIVPLFPGRRRSKTAQARQPG
jgi:GntR family transcriptional regulator, transcriptional repressor for pyruvate dehydrogenase complex